MSYRRSGDYTGNPFLLYNDPMEMLELIAIKRDGGELSAEQIKWFVGEVTAGTAPDYQVAAMLMAIYLRGMTARETVQLTLAMADSGARLDLHDVAPFVVDKHSSGGVGDKTSLVVLPLVAACGMPVGKMSGRGLGSSGGTLDKMESITGWSGAIELEQFKRQLREIGLVLAGQTAELAPADGRLYALRDVTGTVASLPLIAASIMSKKLAAGADAIVLDVKVGNGAFMRDLDSARELAQMMVQIGKDAGRKMVALLSDMNQPLGEAVGNSLEVREAIHTLRGEGPARFWAHCLDVAGHMLLLAGRAVTLDEARQLLVRARNNGTALAKFRQMVVAQGGNGAQVDDPSLLPAAAFTGDVRARQSGYLAGMDTEALGWTAVRLGAGRLTKNAPIDPAVGFVMRAQVGDFVRAGEPVAVVHANSAAKLQEATSSILAALTWSDQQVPPLPHVYETIIG